MEPRPRLQRLGRRKGLALETACLCAVGKGQKLAQNLGGLPGAGPRDAAWAGATWSLISTLAQPGANEQAPRPCPGLELTGAVWTEIRDLRLGQLPGMGLGVEGKPP